MEHSENLTNSINGARVFTKRQDRLKYLQGFMLHASLNDYDLSIKGLCTRVFGDNLERNIRKIQRDIKFLVDNRIIEITKRFYKGSTKFFKVRFFQFFKKSSYYIKKSTNFLKKMTKSDGKISTDSFKSKYITKLSSCQEINQKKLYDLSERLSELERNGINKIDHDAFLYAFNASTQQKIKSFSAFYKFIEKNKDLRIKIKYLKDILEKIDIHKHIKIKYLRQYDIFGSTMIKAAYCDLRDFQQKKDFLFGDFSAKDVVKNVVSPSRELNILDNNIYNNNNTAIKPFKTSKRDHNQWSVSSDMWNSLRNQLKTQQNNV